MTTNHQEPEAAHEELDAQRGQGINKVDPHDEPIGDHPFQAHPYQVLLAEIPDLRPPPEPAFLRRHRPDVVVYFTDGCGPTPDLAPRIPVIWCLTQGGNQPADWGREIKM